MTLTTFRLVGQGLLLLLLWPMAGVQAQGELSPFFLPRSLQGNLLNPASSDGGTVSIGLASPSLLVSHSGFAFGDLVQPVPGQDSSFLAFDQLLSELGDNNRVQGELRADLLSLAIGIRSFRLLAGVSSRARLDMSYPKDLIRLAWNGNAPYLGETMSIGPAFRAMAWQEVFVGGQMKVGESVQVGGRLKYLSGTGYAGTRRSQLAWTTSPETYAWDLDLDYSLQTAGLDLGELGDSIQLSPSVSPSFFQQNHGVSVDVGVLFRPIKQLELGFSAVDIGSIKWTGMARHYDAAGSLTFDGVDLSPLWQGDSIDFAGLPDSLLQAITVAETEETFSTALPGRYQVSVALEPLRWVRVSSIVQAEYDGGTWRPALAVGAQTRAGKWLDFGLSWMARDGQWDIIGLQTSLRAGPVVTYLMSDHILAPLRARQAQMAHVRLGMNIQLGYKKDK